MTVQPHDPFAVDVEHALEALGVLWDDIYNLGARDGAYKATRRQSPHKTVTASTPDKLNKAILADFTGGIR